MFHIVNKTYFEYDFKFSHQYPFTAASSRWTEHPLLVSNQEIHFEAPSFEKLLEDEFNNDIEQFWKAVVSKEEKYIYYLTPDRITELQIQYWRSILAEDPSVETIHFLHTSWVESTRLNAYNQSTNSWSVGGTERVLHGVLSDVNFMTLDEIRVLYDRNPPSETLRRINLNKISFEYLLLDYFARSKKSQYKPEFLRRLKIMTWDNWIDELEHLKYEILSGTIDAGKLDPSINVKVGNIEEQLAKSEFLSWTVDPFFKEDPTYIRETYDHRIFVPCWQRLADAWDLGYDDMEELNEMINHDEYENLLMRDIERGYGSSYTRTRFMDKANQVLSTWCYEMVRNDNVSALRPFKLRNV